MLDDAVLEACEVTGALETEDAVLLVAAAEVLLVEPFFSAFGGLRFSSSSLARVGAS